MAPWSYLNTPNIRWKIPFFSGFLLLSLVGVSGGGGGGGSLACGGGLACGAARHGIGRQLAVTLGCR